MEVTGDDPAYRKDPKKLTYRSIHARYISFSPAVWRNSTWLKE
jgi:hypothetical protein